VVRPWSGLGGGGAPPEVAAPGRGGRTELFIDARDGRQAVGMAVHVQIPTTAARFGGRLAVVNAKFDTGIPPTADQYEVVVVEPGAWVMPTGRIG
jgi:hypothetical protein